MVVSEVITEIASGMNGNRTQLIRLLKNKDARCILVEHRDRLTRFGFEYFEILLKSTGRSIMVLDSKEISEDNDG
jgi:putative resolvase